MSDNAKYWDRTLVGGETSSNNFVHELIRARKDSVANFEVTEKARAQVEKLAQNLDERGEKEHAAATRALLTGDDDQPNKKQKKP